MFPWTYGFHWAPGTVIFLGVFYAVVTVILLTLTRAAFRSWRDMRLGKADSIRWVSDFHDLPARDRSCRHQLSGLVKDRTCHNAFDCRQCEAHPKFVAQEAELIPLLPAEPEIFGLCFPADRSYHRGHTWARQEADGTVTIGLDALGQRMIGTPERIQLPADGIQIHANGTAWRVRKNGADVRVLSPVDGQVVATGSPSDDWLLRVKPVNGGFDTRNLLQPHEVKPWVMRELERLQIAVGGPSVSLADGGVPVADISQACPPEKWDALCGEIFLEP